MYSSSQSGSQEPKISLDGLEYAFFMRAYQLLEKHYGHLPEYRGISHGFLNGIRMVTYSRITRTRVSSKMKKSAFTMMLSMSCTHQLKPSVNYQDHSVSFQ